MTYKRPCIGPESLLEFFIMTQTNVQNALGRNTLLKDFDTVNPGENWFLYWKTSASLWEEKMQLITSPFVIVPLNWWFHFDEENHYDFGNYKPETHLKTLVDIGLNLHKDIVFFLPLVPTPFLANGGIPHLYGRHVIKLENSLPFLCLDAERNIHKLYSFFDTSVFKAFQQFCFNLGEYFTTNKINTHIYGLNYGHLKGDNFCSYLDDHSSTFEKAFVRFLKKEKSPSSQTEEKRRDFVSGILDLYSQTAQDALKEFWRGTKRAVFLGGGPSDFFMSLNCDEQKRQYTKALFSCLQKNYLPSSILLSKNTKQGNLSFQLNHLISPSYNKSFLNLSIYGDEETEESPLIFFDILSHPQNSYWEHLRLFETLEENFKSLYRIREDKDFSWDEKSHHETIYFFEGSCINLSRLNDLIKIFMNGQRLIINKDGLSPEVSKKLEVFFLENSLKVEKVHYQTMLHYVSFGKGRILLFDGIRLKDNHKKLYKDFWKKIFSLFHLKHVSLKGIEEIDIFWQIKYHDSRELNYEEIRRLNLYNSTSYKQKVTAEIPSGPLALLQFVDDLRVNIKGHLSIINLEFLPEGRLSIDFGVCPDV